jgi:hypothetical protein
MNLKRTQFTVKTYCANKMWNCVSHFGYFQLPICKYTYQLSICKKNQISQIVIKYTYQMTRKRNKIQCKAIKNTLELDFLVRKYTIWQPCGSFTFPKSFPERSPREFRINPTDFSKCYLEYTLN